MNSIRQAYYAGTIIVLMIIRYIMTGTWFGSIVVAGVFISWIDIIVRTIKRSANLSNGAAKKRAAIIITFLGIIGFAILCVGVVNIVIPIDQLQNPVILDELTLLALLLCFAKDIIVGGIRLIIGKDNRWPYGKH